MFFEIYIALIFLQISFYSTQLSQVFFFKSITFIYVYNMFCSKDFFSFLSQQISKLQNSFLILKLAKIENQKSINLHAQTIKMNLKIKTISHPSSPILTTPKSNQKRINVSSKRKLLISPSKDLLVFFGQTNLNNFSFVQHDKKQQKTPKLTLNRKQIQKRKNTQQNNIIQPLNNYKKYNSITNSTTSCESNKKALQQKEQKFLKLRKQVDQIRRKYSHSKMKYQLNFDNKQKQRQKSLQKSTTKNGSQILFRISTSSNGNVSFSLNQSKQKILTPLTPKNDRNLLGSRKIFKKNIFETQLTKNHNKLLLKSSNFAIQNQNNKRLKLTQSYKYPLNQQSVLSINNNKQNFVFPMMSVSSKRKSSFEFGDIKVNQILNQDRNLNINSQLQNLDAKKTFQFTFGSMAMMDLHSKDNKLLLK